MFFCVLRNLAIFVYLNSLVYTRLESRAERTSQKYVVLHLKLGKIRGKMEPVPGRQAVEEFLSIPFAEPPIRELRFAPPRPAKPWNGVRDATKHGAKCIYGPVNISSPAAQSRHDSVSEDCLFLNVYRPANTKATKNLPVMFWLHGGGYYRGSANLYDGSPLAAFNDIIMVTTNYRLGLLGFLNVPGTGLKGNYGMLDQVMALKWVQENIGCFGGDPANVTIFGESAGGASGMLLSISPLSNGLFNKVILQSPTETYGVYPRSDHKVYLQRLGCIDEAKALSCLQGKTTNEIIEAQGIVDYLYLGHVFPVPAVDGDFLPHDPDVMIAEGHFNQIDAVIIGVNKNEGGFHWHGVKHSQHEPPTTNTFVSAVRNVNFVKSGDPEIVKQAIFYQYTNHTDPASPENILHNWQKLVSDYRFFSPSVRMANAFVKAGIPTFFYHFSHWSTYSKRPKSVGVVHFDEIPYVQGIPWKKNPSIQIAADYTDVERGLSSLVMRMWGNFAKYGNPVNQEGHDLVSWPPYTTKTQQYLDINLVTSVHSKLHSDQVAFWNEFLPKLLKNCQSNMSIGKDKS